MSLYPILWAADHAPVRDAEERAILVALVIKGDFDGCNCFRSYKTLAEKARVDPKTAGRRCREMAARGLLKRQEKHRSKAWLAIPEEQRPVIWEVMIPAEWWSAAQLADINDQRAGLGRPPLTPQNRPALTPAPPKKARTDKGTKRPKKDDQTGEPNGVQSGDPGTTSPGGGPGTSSPHPQDYKSVPPGLVVPQPSESPSESPSENNRAVADARRATAGSSARKAASGSAATDKTGSADVAEGGQVPKPRKGTGGKGARKESPFPAEVRQGIYATEALLPAPLRALLAEQFPYGHLPNVNRQVTAQALEVRTPEQLGQRAARRWVTYGYERDHFDGVLRSPLGVVEELLRPTPYCPDAECEDGENIATDQPCRTCEARIAQRRNDRRAGRWVPEHRPPRLYRDREQCEVCDRPFPGTTPEDHVCGGCRAELDRARAYLTGVPVEEPEETDPGTRAAPPSSEYRRYREQQAQARLDAVQSPHAPF